MKQLSYLCDDHNPLVLLTDSISVVSRLSLSRTSLAIMSAQGHLWNTEETREDPMRVEYSGARVRWCWSSRTEEHTMEQNPAQHFKCHLMD